MSPVSEVPSELYKYCSAQTAKIVLQNQTLRWSEPRKFNDIQEFQLVPHFAGTYAEAYANYLKTIFGFATNEAPITKPLMPIAAWMVEAIRRMLASGMRREEIEQELLQVEQPPEGIELRRVAELVSQWMPTARILCLSSNSNQPILWAWYGCYHQGCVLAFRHIPELDTPLIAAKPINYTMEYPTVGPMCEVLLYGASLQLRERVFEAICYTKSSEWAYESEWRALTFRDYEGDKGYGDYPFYADELAAIIFGCKMKSEERIEVAKIARAKYPKARLLKSVENERRLGVGYVPYDD